MRKSRKFTEHEKKFLIKIIPGRTVSEATELFNMEFPEAPIEEKNIRYFKNNNGIKSGVDTRWGRNKEHDMKRNKLKPGQTIPNSEKTQFKKGNKPYNTLPVGTVVLKSDGYYYKKLKETKPSYRGWKQVHHIIWESANGPIPKGHIVVFINQDRSDLRLENLMLITKAENARLNQYRLNTGDAETLKLGIAIAQLSNAAGRKKKELEENKDGST